MCNGVRANRGNIHTHTLLYAELYAAHQLARLELLVGNLAPLLAPVAQLLALPPNHKLNLSLDCQTNYRASILLLTPYTYTCKYLMRKIPYCGPE